jgi:hypothetical protein
MRAVSTALKIMEPVVASIGDASKTGQFILHAVSLAAEDGP